MLYKNREDYELEDFLMDESFSNYHFHLNAVDELSWKIWLEQHPEKTSIVSEARAHLQTLSLTITDKEYQQEFEKLQQLIKFSQPKSNILLLNWNKLALRRNPLRRKLLYASPILFSFIVLSYLFLNKRYSFKEITNNTTSSLMLILTDSTQVSLAPHAILRFPSKFTGNERKVYLEGAAEFNVKHNEQAPFKVYYQNIVATVLGTVFKIKRPLDSSIVIELIKGRLKVDLNETVTERKEVILNPNEKLVYNKRGHVFYVNPIAPQNNLSFHQNTFEEIAMQIKKVFGITILNESKKKDWRFTGSFRNTSAKEIMENICQVKNLSMELKGETIYIR